MKSITMKVSSCAILSVCAILLCTFALTSSAQSEQNFIQCLSSMSNTTPPISESVITPDNSSFTKVMRTYIKNLVFNSSTTPKPQYIVQAKHESHVQATIVCAKNHGLQIRSLSGAHDYEGLSYVSHVPFVILDMSYLREIDINIEDETAWVQAGATIGELYYRIAEKSLIHAFPSGVCLTVGAGGHFSGGGYGNLMRKYGLSVDHIVDAQLVDVNGKILDRSTMGEDVFWAIRGGGPSFGVILSWKIKLVRVPRTVTVFNVTRTLEQNASDIVYKWQLIAPNLPKELFIRVMSTTEGEKALAVLFIGHFLGNPKELVALTNRSFPELRLQEDDCTPMSWVNSTLNWANYPIGTPLEVLLNRSVDAGYFKRTSDYVKIPFTKDTLESIWQQMLRIGNIWIQWNPYGGRMSEIPEDATPFPHRAGNLFLLGSSVDWEQENETNFYEKLAREFYDFMAPFVSKDPREAFLDYRDLNIGANPSNVTFFDIAEVYGSKYFKGNFDRLVRAKSQVDPDNFFKNEQSIPPLPQLWTSI